MQGLYTIRTVRELLWGYEVRAGLQQLLPAISCCLSSNLPPQLAPTCMHVWTQLLLAMITTTACSAAACSQQARAPPALSHILRAPHDPACMHPGGAGLPPTPNPQPTPRVRNTHANMRRPKRCTAAGSST